MQVQLQVQVQVQWQVQVQVQWQVQVQMQSLPRPRRQRLFFSFLEPCWYLWISAVVPSTMPRSVQPLRGDVRAWNR